VSVCKTDRCGDLDLDAMLGIDGLTPRRNRSRKRFAASSNAKRLESAVFYLDESIYSRVLLEELERAGVSVRRPGVDVPYGAPDAVSSPLLE
jgi:hypothetical protein